MIAIVCVVRVVCCVVRVVCCVVRVPGLVQSVVQPN